MLHNHFSSLKKKENGGYASVETLAWSPPTQDWRKNEDLGKLSLKVGDAEKIDEIKEAFIQAVKSEERTKCFDIQPHSIEGEERRKTLWCYSPLKALPDWRYELVMYQPMRSQD